MKIEKLLEVGDVLYTIKDGKRESVGDKYVVNRVTAFRAYCGDGYVFYRKLTNGRTIESKNRNYYMGEESYKKTVEIESESLKILYSRKQLEDFFESIYAEDLTVEQLGKIREIVEVCK